MSLDPSQQKLRVTLDELAAGDTLAVARLADLTPASGPMPETRSYGNINANPEAPTMTQEKGSVLLQGWFYLGVSGMLGAIAGWAAAEPFFTDGPGRRWGNLGMIPSVVAVMCVAFAIAESIIERSSRKALIRAGLALPLGVLFGMLFSGVGNAVYAICMSICGAAGVQSYHNPSVWIARGIAWTVLGAAGGVVYGIIGQSMKKTGYGVLGGVLGAAIGGVIFDPISFATHGGAPSRVVGFSLLGLATGVAMGLVESALKDRWMYVTAGPLAGKQFILYKSHTTMGSSQQCDIYLFKDANILPEHVMLEVKGSRTHLSATGPVYVSGQPVRGLRVLESGNIIQLGRYSFRYQEKQRG